MRDASADGASTVAAAASWLMLHALLQKGELKHRRPGSRKIRRRLGNPLTMAGKELEKKARNGAKLGANDPILCK